MARSLKNLTKSELIKKIAALESELNAKADQHGADAIAAKRLQVGEENMKRAAVLLDSIKPDDAEVVEGLPVPKGFGARLNEIWNDGWRPPVAED